jgi:hypothetical protein
MKKLREPAARVDFDLICTTGADDTKYHFRTSKSVIKHYGDWGYIFVSNVPLDNSVAYFEIEYDFVGSQKLDGLFVGVTDDPKTKIRHQSVPIIVDTTCALYNSDNGNHHTNITVTPTGTLQHASASGDVFGVVVDRNTDQILFYWNGVFVAEGIKKPSELNRPLYAFVSLFYKNSRIALVEKYEYRNLKRHENK